jgi:hypothetical protein
MSPHTKAGLSVASIFLGGILIGMLADWVFPVAGGYLQSVGFVAAGIAAMIYWLFRPPRRPTT